MALIDPIWNLNVGFFSRSLGLHFIERVLTLAEGRYRGFEARDDSFLRIFFLQTFFRVLK